MAFAIDLVSRKGGTGTDNAVNSGALGGAVPEDLIADIQAGINYLKALPSVTPTAIGVTGFCFGGGYAFEAAISSKDLKAVVPYYGTVRRMPELGTTAAAVLVMYGGNDARVTRPSKSAPA